MRNRIYKFMGASLLLVGMVACEKKLDINKNPNQASDQSVTAELILPNALHYTGAQTAVGGLLTSGSYSAGYGWLSNWMGYWSPSGSYNPSTEESSYNITNTFQDVKWEGIYNVLFDLTKVEEKATANNQPFYRSIALIVKAHLFQNLVDIYGNVPYSQAFKPTEYPTPAFDKAEDIYKDLQVKLDTAINLLKTATVTSTGAKVDIVFNGDKTLWTKLGNTLKLRLLIRQSEINANPSAELAKIKENGGVLQSGESADVNPGYQNDVNKQSPFYSAFGLLPSGQEANTYYRANAYAINNFKSTNDTVRLAYYFKKAKSPTNAANPYVGTTYGAESSSALGGDQTSNIGEGLTKSFNQDQWIVTSIESMFLQAEAIYRGWDIGGPYTGNPKAAYEAAVIESFKWLGVPNAIATAATFLQSSSASWDNATTPESKLQLIVKQKYIALTGINPLEAWNDYRRLGIPSNIPLSVNSARGSRQIPVRLLYPAGELAVNAKNVQAQGDITPQTKIFWDK